MTKHRWYLIDIFYFEKQDNRNNKTNINSYDDNNNNKDNSYKNSSYKQ